jgi:hypothetical protein
MTGDEYTCGGWACTDCLILLANGDAPAELDEAELAAWLAEIDTRNAGYQITLGLLREDHACTDEAGQTEADRGGECECEVQSFSWSACDVCGSNLGGERHAVSFFKVTS